MISNDFEYQLQKTNLPIRDKKPNQRMKHITRLTGTTMAIIKLVHNEGASSSTQEDTLQPFVIYSLNKKDRWQLSDKMSAQVLENLQEPEKMVVVVERNYSGLHGAFVTKYGHTHSNHLMASKVKSVYQLDPEFSKKTCRGVGRKHVEIDVAPDVSYNVFKNPSNFNKLYANKRKSTCTSHYSRNYSNLLRDELQDISEDENLENDIEEVEEASVSQNKCYNLMDHLVTKPRRKNISHYYDFVIV